MGGLSLGELVETMKKKLLIVGGGTAGWMAAGYFSQKGYPVTLIESDQVPIVGVGESTLPAMNAFAHELGMTESEWMPLSDATFKLGIKHMNWTEKEHTWWHWFLYDRTKEPEQHQHLENGTLPPREELKYAYHVNAFQFGETIAKVVALRNGAKHVVAHIDQVIGDPERGIEAVITRDGQRFDADFYIDCTGWKKLLGSKVGVRYHHYEHLIQDRAFALPGPAVNAVANRFTTTRATRSGWIWEVPLTSRRGTGHVFSSRFTTDEQAKQEYLEIFPECTEEEIKRARFIDFRAEIALNTINTNVGMVGLSNGFIEPLEATSIFGTQFMIQQIHLYLSGEREARVINRNIKWIFDEIALFVLAHYTLSKRQDTEFWRYYHELEGKLNTREQVLERANRPDLGFWESSTLFKPYSWWALANSYGLLEKE